MRQFLETPLPVLVEERRHRRWGWMMGWSPNYLPVALVGLTETDANRVHTVIPRRIVEGVLVVEAHNG